LAQRFFLSQSTSTSTAPYPRATPRQRHVAFAPRLLSRRSNSASPFNQLPLDWVITSDVPGRSSSIRQRRTSSDCLSNLRFKLFCTPLPFYSRPPSLSSALAPYPVFKTISVPLKTVELQFSNRSAEFCHQKDVMWRLRNTRRPDVERDRAPRAGSNTGAPLRRSQGRADDVLLGLIRQERRSDSFLFEGRQCVAHQARPLVILSRTLKNTGIACHSVKARHSA
jgi:hypothetical protein